MQALRLLGRQASASAPRRFTAFAYGGARPMSSASAAVPEEPEEPAKEEATVSTLLERRAAAAPCTPRPAPPARPPTSPAPPAPTMGRGCRLTRLRVRPARQSNG